MASVVALSVEKGLVGQRVTLAQTVTDSLYDACHKMLDTNMACFSLEGNSDTSLWSSMGWLLRKQRNVSKLAEKTFLALGSFFQSQPSLPTLGPSCCQGCLAASNHLLICTKQVRQLSVRMCDFPKVTDRVKAWGRGGCHWRPLVALWASLLL